MAKLTPFPSQVAAERDKDNQAKFYRVITATRSYPIRITRWQLLRRWSIGALERWLDFLPTLQYSNTPNPMRLPDPLLLGRDLRPVGTLSRLHAARAGGRDLAGPAFAYSPLGRHHRQPLVGVQMVWLAPGATCRIRADLSHWLLSVFGGLILRWYSSVISVAILPSTSRSRRNTG